MMTTQPPNPLLKVEKTTHNLCNQAIADVKLLRAALNKFASRNHWSYGDGMRPPHWHGEPEPAWIANEALEATDRPVYSHSVSDASE